MRSLSGASAASVAAGFLNSAEFRGRFGPLDDAGFAARLARHLGAPDLAWDVLDALAGVIARWVAPAPEQGSP